MVNAGGPGFHASVVGSCGGLARPRRRAWPPLVTAHARAAAETAGCRPFWAMKKKKKNRDRRELRCAGLELSI